MNQYLQCKVLAAKRRKIKDPNTLAYLNHLREVINDNATKQAFAAKKLNQVIKFLRDTVSEGEFATTWTTDATP